MRRFEGKHALVTGGSSGIGLAVAQRLRAEGARVAISARDGVELREAAATMGGDVLATTADVADIAQIDRLFEVVASSVGRLDVLFVNAGIGRLGRLEDMSAAMYDEIFSINARGAYFTVQKALPHLNSGASIILNALAPVAPAWRRPGTSAYTASKAVVASLARTLSAELADRGIRVNAVSPGPIVTNIYRHAGVSAEAVAERRARMEANIPLRRSGDVSEVAGVVAFLASQDASYITGQEIVVDGGMA